MSLPHDLGMGRYLQLPPLWVRLCAAAGIPPESSLDTVHERVNVIGRGTLQRIRDGVSGTQIKSIQAAADHLHVPIAALLDESTTQEPEPAWSSGVERLVDELASLLDSLDLEGQDHAAKALAALAAAPDSAKAKAAVVRLLMPVAASRKRSRRVA